MNCFKNLALAAVATMIIFASSTTATAQCNGISCQHGAPAIQPAVPIGTSYFAAPTINYSTTLNAPSATAGNFENIVTHSQPTLTSVGHSYFGNVSYQTERDLMARYYSHNVSAQPVTTSLNAQPLTTCANGKCQRIQAQETCADGTCHLQK